jgi:2-keto-4-pentenoate hydratase/2-oxohepta-3-ene-1,7-dioic acid hydratase in catechol pathway
MATWCRTQILGECVLQIANVAKLTVPSEMIFNVPQTLAFLSSGTTIEKGTLIMTGTGPGIGAMRDPKVVLNHGDDMRVEMENIGTLINEVYYE